MDVIFLRTEAFLKLEANDFLFFIRKFPFFLNVSEPPAKLITT